MAPAAKPTVIVYRRVSTDEQGVSGLGLEAQTATIVAELGRRGWAATADYFDVASGKTTERRPGLAAAVDHVRRSRGVLVASKLDRVSRNVIDFATLLQRAKRERWCVLVLDMPIDTTTPAGRYAAITMANGAEFERDMISDRTSSALQIKKANGDRLGRPRKTPDKIVRRIVEDRDAGQTWQAIADALNSDGVPTVRGGAMWRVSTVQRAFQSAQLDAQAQNATRPAASAV